MFSNLLNEVFTLPLPQIWYGSRKLALIWRTHSYSSSFLIQLCSRIIEIGDIHKLPLYSSLGRKEEVKKKKEVSISSLYTKN